EAERDRLADHGEGGGGLPGGRHDLDGDAVVAGVASGDAGLAGAAGAGGLVDLALGADGVVDAGAGGGDDAAVLQQLRRLGDLVRLVLGSDLAGGGADHRVAAGAVAGAQCAGAGERAAAAGAAGGGLGVVHGPPPNIVALMLTMLAKEREPCQHRVESRSTTLRQHHADTEEEPCLTPTPTTGPCATSPTTGESPTTPSAPTEPADEANSPNPTPCSAAHPPGVRQRF